MLVFVICVLLSFSTTPSWSNVKFVLIVINLIKRNFLQGLEHWIGFYCIQSVKQFEWFNPWIYTWLIFCQNHIEKVHYKSTNCYLEVMLQGELFPLFNSTCQSCNKRLYNKILDTNKERSWLGHLRFIWQKN